MVTGSEKQMKWYEWNIQTVTCGTGKKTINQY